MLLSLPRYNNISTPLHSPLRSDRGHKGIVELLLLLSDRVDVSARADNGVSPAQAAKKAGHRAVYNMVQAEKAQASVGVQLLAGSGDACAGTEQ